MVDAPARWLAPRASVQEPADWRRDDVQAAATEGALTSPAGGRARGEKGLNYAICTFQGHRTPNGGEIFSPRKGRRNADEDSQGRPHMSKRSRAAASKSAEGFAALPMELCWYLA